jgi:ankyrin repeat protein
MVHLESGNLEAVKKFFEDDSSLIDIQSLNGWTPLMYAARYGQLELVKFFVSKNASFERPQVIIK